MLSLVFLSGLLAAQAAPADGPHYVKPVCAGDEGSGFGYRVDAFTGRVAFHSGLDFAVEPGHPVVASAAGRVVVAGNKGPYGLLVEIDHGRGHKTRYGHLSKLAVDADRRVAQGAAIGWSGATGRASAPGLHFEVWRSMIVHDPRKVLHPNPRCVLGVRD